MRSGVDCRVTRSLLCCSLYTVGILFLNSGAREDIYDLILCQCAKMLTINSELYRLAQANEQKKQVSLN